MITGAKHESRYRDRLDGMPAPKHGRHTALLGIANLGFMAGKTSEDVHDDLRRVTADNPMPDNEIRAAVMKAASDHGAGSTYRPMPKPTPLIKDGKAALQRIIDQAPFSDAADLFEISPIRLNDSPESDRVLLLKTHFKTHELVFIGDRLELGVIGQNIRTAAEWIVFFATGGTAGPHIIINPLNGIPAPKKSGDGDTQRGDGNVKTFRHCLVEFDDLPREDQIKFWSAAKLPILALIDSGGKSIHAWIDVSKLSNVTTGELWNQEIKINLYEKILCPLGVDRSCSNPSRLSRLPGYMRVETGKQQRLLWLATEGQRVAG
jgi:hypothetical protein